MTVAVVWLIAGIVLLGVEVFTGAFVLVMLGGGALAAAAASAFLGTSLPVDAAVFAVVSVLLLAAVRPALQRRLHIEPDAGDGSMVGLCGVVVRRVDGHDGQIKIEGELWSARAMDRDRIFEPGERVSVMQLSGLTAVVSTEL